MANVRQLSFSAGEITPALYGRVDLFKYAAGLKTCRNFLVMRHGGASNRAGTEFVCETKDSTKKVRLIPFVFNNEQTYILEFGDQYMRVIRKGAQVTETAKNIEGATRANPCVITITSHGYSNGDEVYIKGVKGMTQLNGRNFKVANVTANTFEIRYMDGTNVDSTSFGAYTTGGTAAKIYEITTPYLEADLPALYYVQSADTITITHPSYAPRELARTGHAAWTLSTITFGAKISAPTGLASNSAGTSYYYVVTAVDALTSEESLPSAEAGSSTQTSTLTWNAVSGAGSYNVYKKKNGRFGFIGVAGETSFKDDEYDPDVLDVPPVDRQPFNSPNNYPAVCTYYQQRRCFFNTNNSPEGVWMSRSASRNNFMVSSPIQDDDAITFTLVGNQVNSIRGALDVGGKLVVFTSSGEWVIEGDADGVLTPSAINPRQYTANGSAAIMPIKIAESALYVQARGSVVRDLTRDITIEGYKGNELSIFSSHLVDNYTIADWTYQQIPHSIVWIVRNDGKLLGCTYVREHMVSGWHIHDFENGFVENVLSIPEGTEDVLYLVIKRTINGRTVRYIERMATRKIENIVDSKFMDCSLSFDGRNTNTSHTMTLSGGTNWTYNESLTLTSSISYFVPEDIGNAIHFTNTGGSKLRCEITGYTSDTVVTVKPNKTVPSSLRNTASSNWSKAIKTLKGLWHLEGKNISVFGDGFVVANPNNSSYAVLTVANGSVTLSEHYSVIHAGLPITSDLETLNIDLQGVSSLADKRKNIGGITVFVESTRGIWAGPSFDRLREARVKWGSDLDDMPELQTGTIDINITPEWNSTGKVCIRQIDPLPVSILSIVPQGYIA